MTSEASADRARSARHFNRFRPSELVVLVGFGACGLWLFFGKAIESHFSFYPGDLGDWRFNGVIVEHWLSVLKGQAEWRSPIFFYPVKNVLGYSDSLLLFVPFYLPFRLAGIEPSLAFVFCFMSIISFGYVSCYWLISRVFGYPRIAALGVAFAFIFSNMAAIRFGHAQLYSYSFLPILIALGFKFARSILNHKPSVYFGVAFSIGIAALLYTGFYIGYYLMLFLLFFSLIFIALDSWLCWPSTKRTLLALWDARNVILLCAASFGLALTPFLLTYLPTHGEFGARDWSFIQCMLPRPKDLINVDGNAIWSWIASSFAPDTCPYPWELTFGLPLGTLCLFAASFVWLARAYRYWQEPASADQVAVFGPLHKDPRFEIRILASLGLTVVLCWLLMLRLDQYSLWYIIYTFFPGASALRAIYRFQMVLHFFVLIMICGSLSKEIDDWPRPSKLICFGAVVALISVEQLNRAVSYFQGASVSRQLDLVPAPPPGCRQFFLEPGPVKDQPFYVGNLHAVILAQKFGVPTLNGYSGSLPRGFAHPDFAYPGYLTNVAQWAHKYRVLDGLCMLNLKTNAWAEVRDRTLEINQTLYNENLNIFKPTDPMGAFSFFRTGFHALEGTGAWTMGQGRIEFTVPVTGVRSVVVGGHRGLPKQPLTIDVSGRKQVVDPNTFDFQAEVFVDGPVSSIEIKSESYVPVDRGIGFDTRLLGVFVDSIILKK